MSTAKLGHLHCGKKHPEQIFEENNWTSGVESNLELKKSVL
jgi:hypothetical protein